jgi:hypothetical protein
MKVGKPSPQWAQDLIYKWIELEKPVLGSTNNVFVFATDCFPEQGVVNRVRIFAEPEEDAKADFIGQRDIGLFATFIEEGKFKVIDTPPGLEEWTEEIIKE